MVDYNNCACTIISNSGNVENTCVDILNKQELKYSGIMNSPIE